MKKITLCAKNAVLVAFAALSFGASAQNVTHTFSSVGVDFDLSTFETKAAGAFTDYWKFTITEPLFSYGVLNNVTGGGFKINDLSVVLYGGVPTANPNTSFFIDDLGDNVDSKIGVTYSGSGNYVPGEYYFAVSGVAAGSKGGKYTFSATTTALAPVPEPETYAMLLAGLGLIGGIAIRRSKIKTA